MMESHPEIETCYMKEIPESSSRLENFETLMKIKKVFNSPI